MRVDTRKDGFISVVVFLVLSIVLLCSLSVWIGISRVSDVCEKKGVYEYEFWLVQGALSAGTLSAKKMLSNKKQENKNIEYKFDSWPIKTNKRDRYSSVVQCSMKGDLVEVVATLLKYDKTKRKISCIVKKSILNKSNYVVINWTEHAQT